MTSGRRQERPKESTTGIGSGPGLLSSLFDRMAVAVGHGKIVTDGDGRPIDLLLLDMNHAWLETLGRARGEVEGSRATKVFPII